MVTPLFDARNAFRTIIFVGRRRACVELTKPRDGLPWQSEGARETHRWLPPCRTSRLGYVIVTARFAFLFERAGRVRIRILGTFLDDCTKGP